MAYAARLTVTKAERAMSLENMFVDGVVLERYQLSELDEELVVEQSYLLYRLTPVFFFVISRNLTEVRKRCRHKSAIYSCPWEGPYLFE